MTQRLKKLASDLREEWRLPSEARQARARDRTGLSLHDPGIEATVAAAAQWLCRAQDRSASADGGVARDYSVVGGWATSYPETTGYIVPTFFDLAEDWDDHALVERARRMLDWLIGIQFPEGGFQGGKIDAAVQVPVTFNTGQILLGLARGARLFGGGYLDAMHRAAQWLVDTQDEDGCWRRHPTPFAAPGEKTYETHVAWGLFEAARVEPGDGYGEAGLRNVDWALTHQHQNGWFSKCCLSDPERPLTHTLGYALRGVVEAWRYCGEKKYLAAACRTAEAIVRVTGPEGRLAGQWRDDWTPVSNWVCVTGSVQIAHSLLLLYEATGHRPYFATASRLNAWARRTVSLEGGDGQRGGIRGSFPIDGQYGRYQYLNWAAKFFIDSNRYERILRESSYAIGHRDAP